MKLFCVTNCILWLFLSSCITPSRNTASVRPKPLIPKAGREKPIPQEAEIEKPLMSKEKFLADFERLTQPSATLLDEDLDLRNQLTNKEKLSPEEEALLYVLNVRLILSPNNTESFEETVIDSSLLEEEIQKNQAPPPASRTITFSTLADEGFSFDQILKDNRFLNASQPVAFITAKALRRDDILASGMNQNLYAYLKEKLSQWPELPLPDVSDAQNVTTKVTPSDPNDTDKELPTNHTQEPNAELGSEQTPPPLDENLDPENILRIAQDLADQGQYLQALNHMRLIKETSPEYAQARSKAIYFMNLGVQELRAKAAGAFESAVNNENVQVKKSYLIKAREYLYAAKNDFPEAEEITSVDDNLSAIERELTKLP